MSKRTFNLTCGWIVVLLAAAGVWVSAHRNTRDVGTGAEASASNNNGLAVRPSREGEADPVRKIRLTHEDVVGMKPAQWVERFQGMHRDVAAEISDEIVLLADELQSELDSGMDSRSEDARAYTETMLTLLSEGALETPR